MSEELLKIKKGISLWSIGTVVSNLLLFLKALILIRYFGPEKYGLLSLVLGLPILFEILIIKTDYYLTYRLPGEIIRSNNESSDDRASLIISSYIVISFFKIFTSLIIYIFASQIASLIKYDDLANAIEICAIVSIFHVIKGPLSTTVFDAFQKFTGSVISETLDKSGQLIAVLIAVTFGFSIEEYLMISLFAVVPVSIFNNTILIKQKDIYIGKFENLNLFKDLKEMMIFSFPNSFRRHLDRYHGVILRYIVGYFLNASAVGIIAFVYNVYDLIWTTCLVGQRVVVVSLAKNLNKDIFLRRIKRVLLNFNFFMVNVFFAMILFAPHITLIIGGEKFLAGSPLIRDLSFSMYFVQLSIVIGTYLVFYQLNYTYLVFQLFKVLAIILTSAFIVYSTLEFDMIPLINNVAVFLEFIFVSSIAVRGLNITLEKRELFFISASLILMILSYYISYSLESFFFYSNIWTFGSIFTRILILMILAFFAYLLHSKSDSFVLNFWSTNK